MCNCDSLGCCDDVKDTKNESHSQHNIDDPRAVGGCCDDVKDTKNESHSQRSRLWGAPTDAVVTMSKILKMKAIHNS